MNGNDTIASYIQISYAKEYSNYIIVGKQLFNQYKPIDIYKNSDVLNRLLSELGIETTPQKGANKIDYMLYLHNNSFTDIYRYNIQNYYLKITPSIFKDEFVSLRRDLKFDQKNQNTNKNNNISVFQINNEMSMR